MGNDEALQVRDKRANNRYFIDNALLRGGWGAKLGPHAIAVYNAIAMHADNETQTAYPSHKKIADLTGMSPRQVPRELEKLAEYRIIHVESRAEQRKPSLITLLDESEWIPPQATDRHMPESHMSASQQANDSQSDEHMTGSHTNNTHENNTQGTKPRERAAEKTPPVTPPRDFLGDVFNGHVNGLSPGMADPAQDQEQYFRYRDNAIQAVKDITKVYPNETQQGEIAQLSAQPGFDFELWQKSIRSCEMGKVRPGNVGCYIDTYRAGGDYSEMCRQRKNGDNHGNDKRTSSRSGLRGDTLTDEQRKLLQSL